VGLVSLYKNLIPQSSIKTVFWKINTEGILMIIRTHALTNNLLDINKRIVDKLSEGEK